MSLCAEGYFLSVHYTVSIVDAAAHLVDVLMQVSDPHPDGQILRLPNWIPGSYMIRDFSRNIVSISASCQGAEVALEKVDKSTWRAASCKGELQLSYRVYAWDLSVRAAHVDQTHAFVNGTSVFLSAEGFADEKHDVVLHRPEHDVNNLFRVSTTLTAGTVDSSGYGVYSAENYDELIDHPIEQGNFKQLKFDACGVPHEVVLTGACHFDEDRLIQDLKTICEYEIRFFGEPAPVDRYVFMVMVVDAGYGGLEHRASTALMITRENLPVIGQSEVSDKYLDFLGLCSHEYFHTWNVKRIKPAAFVPFNLAAESYTELLWFFEGMTSYYDDLVLVRTGLIDEKRYLGVLSKTLTRIQRGSGRLTQTVTDSSFDAWNKFYKQDENAPNAIVSYYAKGALIALCMDAELRSRSDSDVTLDDLMRAMWENWQATQAGLEEQEPQRIASQLVKADLTEFFDPVLYSTDELPVNDALKQFGIDLQWSPRLSSSDMGGTRADDHGEAKALPAAPWLGATIVDASGGVKVMQVMRGGPAEQAGLSAGDLVVAINRLSVSKADVDHHLARYATCTELPVHYFRLGQLFESQLPLLPAPADTAVLSVAQSEKLQTWLTDSARVGSNEGVSGTPAIIS